MLRRTFHWIALSSLMGVLLWGKTAAERHFQTSTRRDPEVTLETAHFHRRSLQRFSLGFENLVADLLWVHLLQSASHEKLRSGTVSWEYAILDSILGLDPRFHAAYPFGASFVSVFRHDNTGARALLEQWTVAAPLNWKSHYNYGFFLFHDEKEYDLGAAKILQAAALPGGPEWLNSLGVRLLSESGATFTSLQTALSLYSGLTDDEAKYRLRRTIQSLNYRLQKSAWAELQQKQSGTARELAQAAQNLEAPEDLRPLLAQSFTFRWNASKKQAEGVLRPEDAYLENSGIFEPAQETP
ncbi:hypothetical protein K2X33_12410 [bacterium]|nr:hypothetical protein [bacterium]